MNTIKLAILTLLALYVMVLLFFYFFQEAVIFLPEKLPSDHQFRFDAPVEERNYTMEDGAVINALLFRSDADKGLIYYHHGNAGNIARWGYEALFFRDQGYDVLIYDFRGYGKSTGERTQCKLFGDAQAIYDELLKEYEQDQIVVYGRSLGTGIATWVAARNQPRQLILETPYYSLPDLAKRHYPFLPAKPMLKFPFQSFRHLRKVTCPVRIFHGTEDEIVPYASGLKLFESAQEAMDIELITIEGGHHNDLSGSDIFREKMTSVLN